MLRYFVCLLLCFAGLCASAEDFTIGTVDRKYYASSHDWYVKLTTPDGHWTFCYDIKTDKLVPGTTYTLDEMIPSYCEAYDNLNRQSHKFATAAYCETLADDGTLLISGSATTVDGMDITLHYGVVPIPTPTDTVDIGIAAAELLDRTNDGYYVLHGTGSGYEAALAVRDYNMAGSFGTDALYLPLCGVAPEDGKAVEILDGRATVKHTAQGYAAEAYFVGADALCYHVTMAYALPAPTAEIDVTAENLAINERYVDDYGQIAFSAANADYSVELWVNSTWPFGHFSGTQIDAESCIVTNKTTDEMQNIHYADIEVSQSATDYYLRGTLYGRDGRLYRLNFSTERILPTREETIEVTDGGFFDNSQNRVVQLYGYSADGTHYVSLGLNTDVLDGTYEKKHTYRDYTYVQQLAPAVFFEPYAATITVTHDADTVYVEATLDCENLLDLSDHPTYKIRMRCVREDITLGFEHDVQGEDFAQTYAAHQWAAMPDDEEPGTVWLEAYDAVSRQVIVLQMNVGTSASALIPPGEYRIDASGDAGTVMASRGLEGTTVTGSYAGFIDASDGSLELPLWFLVEGTVTVSGSGDDLYVEIDALNSCRRAVHATIGTRSEGIPTIAAPTAAARRKCLVGHEVIVEIDGCQYRLSGAQVGRRVGR